MFLSEYDRQEKINKMNQFMENFTRKRQEKALHVTNRNILKVKNW